MKLKMKILTSRRIGLLFFDDEVFLFVVVLEEALFEIRFLGAFDDAIFYSLSFISFFFSVF
jgi:hypothetical protein